MLYLRLLYRFYPATELLAEYRYAVDIARRYGCRRVLDVGCGSGGLGRLLLDKGLVDLYVGLDINSVFRLSDPRALFVVADAGHPPIRSRFDCVFFVNSVFYIGLHVLGEYAGIAKYLVIIDIDPRYPHIWVIDRIEGLGKNLRTPRNKLVRYLEKTFNIYEIGGTTTYYIILQTGGDENEEAGRSHGTGGTENTASNTRSHYNRCCARSSTVNSILCTCTSTKYGY